MTFLKILFLLLIIIPFALFLLYIIDRLMDEMPTREEVEEQMSPVDKRRSRAAAQKRNQRREKVGGKTRSGKTRSGKPKKGKTRSGKSRSGKGSSKRRSQSRSTQHKTT